MLELRVIDSPNQSKSIVQKILNNHLEKPGKLFRPALTTKLSHLLNLDEEVSKKISWASELIHNATLIHDDVVDSAYVRRNSPTLNSILSNSKAVLAGDYLLANVISEMVRSKHFEILRTLALTLEEIVNGEFEQDALKAKDQVNVNDLESIAFKKTGALIAWNCHSVAVCSKRSKNTQNICQLFGLKLGLAFQLKDDNLDYSVESGKEFAKDLKEGLINFTTSNLIQIYPELYYSIYQIRGTNFKTPPWSEEQIEVAKQKTLEDAEKIFSEVHTLLDELAKEEQISTGDARFLDLKEFLLELEKRQR
jgi:geranylgeranyl pyrophosphate synthase